MYMCKLNCFLLMLQISMSAILTHVVMVPDVLTVFMVSHVDRAQSVSLDHFASEVNAPFFLNFGSIYILLSHMHCHQHAANSIIYVISYIYKFITSFSRTGCSGPADVVFVIDSSGSIRSERFPRVLEFIETIVSDLDVHPDRTRIGIALIIR